MKPKNKDTVYIVERWLGSDCSLVPCAVTRTYEKAEELCGQYTQQLLDAGVDEWEFTFEVKAQTYYDE